MDTRSEFRRYIDENSTLPPDTVLGHIAWFSVEDAAYDATKLEESFTKLGLNPQFLPNAINPADAFEKASMEVNKERYDLVPARKPRINLGDYTAEILIREAARTNDLIIRKIIREVKDSRNRKLHHHEVGEFVFYRPQTRNGVVDHASARVRSTLAQGLDPAEEVTLKGLVDKFDQAFHRYRYFHDGQRLRGVIRNYLLYLNAIQMKPSVYFVHANRSDELARLSEFVNGLGAASMFLMPLADLQTLRVEVTEAFQREAEKDFQTVAVEAQKILTTRKGPLRAEAVMKVKRQYDAVMAKASEYSRTLQISQDRGMAAAEVALDMVIALQEKLVDQMEATS